MKNIIVPVREGRGKRGDAKAGETRLLVHPTSHYPNCFEELKSAIWDGIKRLKIQDPEKEKQLARKCISDMLHFAHKGKSHVCEMQYANWNIIFVNLTKFTGSSYNYMTSINVSGSTIMLR